MAKVKIKGREYISLSLPFFTEAMDKIHNNNEYDEDLVPSIVKNVIAFSRQNGYKLEVIISNKLYRWMDIEYGKTDLPWRPQKSETSNVE